MTDTKKEKSKWVDAVSRMIELTQQGKMRWQSVLPMGTAVIEEKLASAVFRSTYHGKLLILYGRKVQERRYVIEQELDQLGLPKLGTPKYQNLWVEEAVLEFIDARGSTLWTFPKISALNDLLAAVQYQVAGVNDFLNSLNEESSVNEQSTEE
jgi:hypothetical protein